MRILVINKFLFPNGGSETYIFRLGDELIRQGHNVEYFGMYDNRNVVGNTANSYTTNMDFHEGSVFSKMAYPLKIIYSREARNKIRLVLDQFKPDVCHLNNFNYQLTPSIIIEIRNWSRKAKHPCKIVYTAHDYQLVCPNHMCRSPLENVNCEKCLNGKYIFCLLNKCIHKNIVKSAIGTMEAFIWHHSKVYENIGKIICCSQFMKSKLDHYPMFRNKTIVMHNFVEKANVENIEKKEYVLYFGRYHKEKGVMTLIDACKKLPDIPFIFAGSGSLESMLEGIENITNVGFKSGKELFRLIAEARFTVYPSEWYENCPFSVMESISLGTPVLGSNIGGIPELIKQKENGTLFESGNVEDLVEKIRYMWTSVDSKTNYDNTMTGFYSPEEYVETLFQLQIY